MAGDLYTHWRDSALTPMFFFFDARCAFIILIFMLRPNWYTFSAVVTVLVFLGILHHYHLGLVAFCRFLRTFVGGSRKVILRRR
jgi:hypothetical protein